MATENGRIEALTAAKPGKRRLVIGALRYLERRFASIEAPVHGGDSPPIDPVLESLGDMRPADDRTDQE
jgi:hypothetical protein